MIGKLGLGIFFCLLLALELSAQDGAVRAGGQPVPGATVTATQGSRKIVTSTDASGHYELKGLGLGPYTVEIDMFGFRPARREFQSVNASPADWTLELQSRANPEARRRQPQPNALQNTQAAALQSQIDTASDADLAAGSAPPSLAATGDSNESFLLNGSLSEGLQAGNNPAQGPGFGGPLGGPALNAQVPTVPGGASTGGGVPAGGGFGGGGGRGGGGGGGGGRGFAGGGFGGGRGGFGQRRGRNPNGRNAVFGNRRNRGRDAMHGSMFFSLQNSALNAKPFSLTGLDQIQPAYAQSKWGITLGGPLRIPHLVNWGNTFFFLNYTGTRSRSPYESVGTVPTPAEREGDFSQSTVLGQPVTIFDPTTGAPFPDSRIPASRINPAALGLLSYFPSPNLTGGVQNYQLMTAVPNNSDALNMRANQNITQRDRLALALNLQNRSAEAQQLFGYQDQISGFGTNATLTYTRNLGEKSLSLLTYTFNRNRNDTLPYFANKTNVAAELGINGTSSVPLNYGPPNLSFTNFASLTDASPNLTRIQYSSIGETWSTTRGSHNVSAGLSFRRSQLNLQTDSNARGTFTFGGLLTSQLGADGQPVPGTGYDFADFLLGMPEASSVRYGDTSTYFRGNVWSAFGQDDWHALSNLTINFGLRYEYTSPLSEKYGHMANLDLGQAFTSASVAVPGQSGLPASLIYPNRLNFAPRVGLAWKPFPQKSFQVRAGYGIYYNPTIYTQLAERLEGQPPFAQTTSLTSSITDPLTLQNGLSALPAGTLITNTYAINPHYQDGYAQTWTFNLQQSLPGSLVLEVGYLGTKGTHLDVLLQPNVAPPGTPPLLAQQLLRIPEAVSFTYETSEGNSIYNALQVRLVRRFRRGLSFNALYTFSKSIDDASNPGGVGSAVAQNYLDLAAERAVSNFNRAQVLNLNWTYSTPFTDNKLLKNWSLSGGLTAESGLPMTARVLGNLTNIGGTGAVGAGRADVTGLPIAGGQFFNLAAFTAPAPGELGDAGRNTIPGIPLVSLNAALARSFSLGERRTLEFRLDSTNALNHVNYTSLYTVVNAANFGLPSAASGMRNLTANVRFRF